MRKLFLQREVLEVGNYLEWLTHTDIKIIKQTLYYWQMRGHFPEPVAKVSNTSWYRREDIISGYMNVASHYGKKYTQEDVERAIEEVLKTNRKLTQEMLNYQKEVCDG